jgi:hypothetical protein
MQKTKFSLIFLIVVLTLACALPTPIPDETTPAQPGVTGGPDTATGPAPDQGGGQLPAVTQPAGEAPAAQATQHDVFAPSVETGGTPAPQAPDAQATATQGAEQKVFAPAIQSGSGGEGDPALSGSGQLDPRVDIQASQQTIPVGQTITVTGRAVDIGTPVYTLILRGEGVQDAPPVLEINSQGQQTPGSGRSSIFELISVQISPDGVTFVFRGLAPGVSTLTIMANGQIPAQEGGGSVPGGGSGELILTVSN